MRKSEMNQDELRYRDLFVETLSSKGWHGARRNQQFDRGLWVSPEASMTYSNGALELRFDLYCEDPRVILYLESPGGKTLGLVFRCEDRLRPLLDTVVAMQDVVSPGNIKDKTKELLAACPRMFKISASGNKLIPVKPNRSK
jgi:hypothetical protein